MDVSDIQQVAVLGAGSMGHGITQVAAMAGYEVTMRDIEQDLVDEGYENIEWSLEKLAEKDRLEEPVETVMARVDTAVDLETAVEDADLVIEAAPENMDLKKDIFGDLDEFAPEETVLASNTSSLSITEMASATSRPEQVVGMHFFNPPVKMDLVEVIYGDETSDETAECAYEFVEAIDKTPIYVRKDVRGFVVNTVLLPFLIESAWMVSEGEATIEEADAAMVHQRGYPMGPFELTDMTGIDVNYHVLAEAGTPIPPALAEPYEAGNYGRKTGKGFYDYEEGEGVSYEAGDGEGFDTLRVEARMINEAARLVGDGVATPDAIDTGMRLGTGFPEGPCRRADKIGLDAVLETLRDLHEATGEARYEPADYLVERVEAGNTGEDAGEGFYEYGEADEREYRDLNATLTDEGLLEIELDRPERLNALSQDLMDEIQHVLETADLDAVRAVVFEGTGDRAFCAGADITGFADMNPADVEVTPVFQTLSSFPRPTLAKIDGFCLGGGLELALACDLRVATEGSEFGFPEITLGLIPGGGGTQRAIRMLSDARAKELVFRGERIDAETAEEWGLINRAVTDDEFDDTVEAFVDDLVSGPPIALRKAKQVMNAGRDQDLSAGLELESQAFGLLLSTDDMMEGASAFMEDRDPEFEGH
ncbi:3-hydroxyacyl-CoA dehydrogenase/enoyl-CoA hydratase family protein [Halorarius halobius]|uniref:3-hydroxyacyl-CoA dehydrogenase/enoyl-CoA hydratase family protein n=1 Tax=Halorarius halobius TaxID=2962671 RepID=UPI0020CC8CEF|nr:3-hydroxyacyl-CoA dehydrogenase NAD-binding domain-containing protein [Halorarius halobius]